MCLASIVYTKEGGSDKYITFCQLPGNPADGHDEYFAAQVCMRHGWTHVSSKMEKTSRRHLTKEEKAAGITRQPYEFFESGKMQFDDDDVSP
jgi:hypothetical protein